MKPNLLKTCVILLRLASTESRVWHLLYVLEYKWFQGSKPWLLIMNIMLLEWLCLITVTKDQTIWVFLVNLQVLEIKGHKKVAQNS